MRYPAMMFFSLWTTTVYAEPSIAIVTNNHSELGALTRKQVADIYMGRITSLPNLSIPLPLDYQGESALRNHFYQALTGKSMAQINAYWARLSFTGQANPPRRLADKATLLRAVEKNPDALGYIESTASSSSVTTLMTVE